MQTLYPQKIKTGDKIRVIAPSTNMAVLSKSAVNIAVRRLTQLGFVVTFSKHVKAKNVLGSSSIKERLTDLHEAFADKSVKLILPATGGYNSNDLLDGIDYELIRKNPKVFCGYSDISVLCNAIYAKTGLVTYSGPQLGSFGMELGFEYTQEYFVKNLMDKSPVSISPSIQWSDDRWRKDQKKRTFIRNKGFDVINKGQASGVIIGGNLCSLNLLQGTSYMPKAKSVILFLEDDDLPGKHTLGEFGRNLMSLLQTTKNVRGLVIGRFQKRSEVNLRKLAFLLRANPLLDKLPIIASADFGHTTPQFTFPIGGTARIVGKRTGVSSIELLKY